MKYLILFLLSFNVLGAEVVSKSVVLNMSKEKLWSALTTAKGLSQWWGKGVKIVPKVGGQFYEPWGKDQLATGKVLSLKKFEMIKFSWREKYFIKGQETICTFNIKKEKKGVRFKITHGGWDSFKDKDERAKLIAGFNSGWDGLLARLKKLK